MWQIVSGGKRLLNNGSTCEGELDAGRAGGERGVLLATPATLSSQDLLRATEHQPFHSVAMAQPKTPAADAVFAVPELFEMILSFLPPVDLLRAQSVSKHFAHTIENSQHSQRALFLAPEATRWWKLDSVMQTVEQTEGRTYNLDGSPSYLASGRLNTMLFVVPKNEKELYETFRRQGRSTYDILANGPSVRTAEFALRNRYTDRLSSFIDVQEHHSCREMYITQPPQTSVVVVWHACTKRSPPASLVTNVYGVTFGDVVDEFNGRLQGRPGCVCPRARLDHFELQLVRYALPSEEEWAEVETDR